MVAVAPIVRRTAQLVCGNENWATTVQGTSADFIDIRQWPVEDGGMFTDSDVRGAAKVAVLGSKVKEALFGTASPVGQVVRIKDMPFKVIGVLSYKGGQTFGGDQDDIVLIPYTTAQRKLLGIAYIQNISISAVSQQAVPWRCNRSPNCCGSVTASAPAWTTTSSCSRSSRCRTPQRARARS